MKSRASRSAIILGVFCALVPSGARTAPSLPILQGAPRYNGPASGPDVASALATSPDGSRVFVTGYSAGSSPDWAHWDYATVAYDAVTRRQIWVARYAEPQNTHDSARALAVSPDGSKVFVTGVSKAYSGTDFDYATVAYDAASGAQIWVTRYNGPWNAFDAGSDLAVSPDGSRVFVTGESDGVGTESDYATLAYDAVSGTQIWVARYSGPARRHDAATALGMSPDGAHVFVTGVSTRSDSGLDYATVAYDAASGGQIWAARHQGTGNVADLAVGPDGSMIYVTGTSTSASTGLDYATVAFEAVSGTQAWVARYSGVMNSADYASAVAVSPDGTRVIVTGHSEGIATGPDYATVGYEAASGTQVWVALYNGPANSADYASAVAISPAGLHVFVTGQSEQIATGPDYATMAYDTVSGAPAWMALYNGPANSADSSTALTVSPDGQVFVTGGSTGSGTDYDYTTVAYCTAAPITAAIGCL